MRSREVYGMSCSGRNRGVSSEADDLIDAFGHIDPKYVSDAEVEIKSKSRMKRMVYVIRENTL